MDDLKQRSISAMSHFGAVASGTTHLTVETILQGEGWTKAGPLLEIGGNLSRSPTAPSACRTPSTAGQYGVGIVIDFLRAVARRRLPVEFVYPS